eukprot:10081046-Alexandrium_andersonii.AAC.1
MPSISTGYRPPTSAHCWPPRLRTRGARRHHRAPRASSWRDVGPAAALGPCLVAGPGARRAISCLLYTSPSPRD